MKSSRLDPAMELPPAGWSLIQSWYLSGWYFSDRQYLWPTFGMYSNSSIGG